MHLHILGICGTFMGGLAALAREAGHTVTGCDTGVYPPMSDQLRSLGIDLIEGYGADQLALKPDIFVVGNVVSRARLADGSPRYALMEAILDSGAPYTSGPQWLAEHVLQGRHVLAVAGTHGKTTTTAMLTWILECAGLAPGFLIGGVPLNFEMSARINAPTLVASRTTLPPGGAAAPAVRQSRSRGPGSPMPLFVIEADEYDTAFFDKRSKFVHYRPRTAILNNLEFDHADIFDDLAAIERQFHHLIRIVPPSGRVIWNALEAPLLHVLSQGCWSEQVMFGGSPLNKDGFTAAGEPHDFDVLKGGAVVGHVSWPISGTHNQLNALAAIAAAEHVGVAPADAAKSLATFQNVKRRMELRGSVQLQGGDVAVYDDFAHHPTAIRTTVDGLRHQLDTAGNNKARILAIFEPRSNTMKLGSMTAQLPWSLEQADLAFCHAGGLSWDARAALTPMAARAQVAANIDELLQQVMAAVQPGDQLLCMSNGGFGGVHTRLLTALSERAGAGQVAAA
jgi:UDP-N-acetylmuramate: L-alanyl-gamma-D-glutamyl-meso-diaminopimelate ligase